MELLTNHIASKTDKIKSVIDLEEKVKQDMFKSVSIPKKTPTFSRSGGRSDDLQEI